jgi:RHS repeat-associated protein
VNQDSFNQPARGQATNRLSRHQVLRSFAAEILLAGSWTPLYMQATLTMAIDRGSMPNYRRFIRDSSPHVLLDQHIGRTKERQTPKVRPWSRVALWATCLFAALLVFLVASPAHAQDVGPTGSYQTSYPIKIPSYHGLEPDLGLTYDSSTGNGLVGVGWKLAGFSYIQRASPGKGAPNYDESDVFFLDGMELIPCEEMMQSPSCNYSVDNPHYIPYTTKTESYRRIAFDPHTTGTGGGAWYVWNKDGTKTTYEPNVSFLNASQTEWRTFNWSIASIEEPAGDDPNSYRNTVEYSYGHASNEKYGVQEQYPMFIDYPDEGARTSIRFSYEERPDPITSATGLDEFSTVRYRLKTIDITVGGQRARAYELRYDNRDSSTGRSLLSEVQEYGRDTEICYSSMQDCDSHDPWWKATFTNRGATLPPVTFAPDDPGEARVGGWTSRSQPTARWSPESGANAYDDTSNYRIPSSETAPDKSAFGSAGHLSHWLSGDLNGDGRDDLILINVQKVRGPWLGPVAIGTAISRPDGSYDRRSMPNPWGVGSHGSLPFLNSPDFFPGDFDGDGRTDIIGVTTGEASTGTLLLVAISNGDGTFRFEHQYTDWRYRPAFAIQFSLSSTISLGVDLQLVGSLVKGLTGYAVGGTSLSYSFHHWQDTDAYARQRWMTSDANGDGKTDVMLAQLWYGPPRSLSLCSFVSTGDSSRDNPGGPAGDKQLFRKANCSDRPYDWDSTHVAVTRVYNGDFDGNGTADFTMVRPYRDSKPGHPANTEYARIDVALSGSGEQPFEEPTSYKTDLPWNEDDVWFPGDPNGDGRTDLMQVIKCPSGRKDPNDVLLKLRCPDEQQRDYDHAALRTYLTGQQGTSFGPTAVRETDMEWHLPHPCGDFAYPPTFWYAADPDGDGRTDFMQMYKEHDHQCHLADDNHLDMAIAYSRPDGTFDIHDPSSDPRLRTDRFWRQYWQDHRETAFISADVNGDGKDDMVFAREKYIDPNPDEGGPWEASTLLSPNTRRDSYRWQPAEVNGDGRSDLVYVEHLNPGIRVHTLLRDTDGSLRSDDPISRDISFPENAPDLDNVDNSHWLPADVNADGRSDLVYVDYSYQDPRGIRIYTLLSDGEGTWTAKYDLIGRDFGGRNFLSNMWEDARRWKPIDVDGDGKVDLVHIGHISHGHPGILVTALFSNGDGTWTPPLDPANLFPWREPYLDVVAPRDVVNWRAMDVNGDGKMDLVHVYNPPSDDSSSSSTCVNTLLSDFRYDKEQGIFKGDWVRRPADLQDSNEECLNLGIPDALNWKSADVNADGKMDLVHVGQGSNTYVIDTLLSTGSGNHWQSSRGTAGDGNWPDAPNWKPADVNGDGRTDLVHVQALRTRAPSYTQTDTLVSLGDGQWKMTQPQVSSEAYPLADNRNWQTADADGDGIDDLVRVDYVEEPGKEPRLQATSFTSDAPLDLTTDFSNGMGGKTTVGYTPSSRWQRWNDPELGCHLPAGLVLHHVSSVTTQEVSSRTSDTVSHDYGCPRWSYAERSFLGWEQVRSMHPETQNSPKSLTLARYKISDECGARIGASLELAADYTILSRTETYYHGDPGWDHNNLGPPPYGCLPESNVEYQCDPGTRVVDDSTCAARRVEFSHDDEFGNLTEIGECSYEGFDSSYDTVAPECEKTNPNAQERSTLIEYKPATGPYIVGLPSREAVFEGLDDEGEGNKPVRDTRYCYDDDEPDTCEASPTRGLLTATKEWDDQNQRYVTTSYGYDDYGNQTSVEDANKICCTTTVFDQTYHLFPEKICNAVGHCTEQKWDPAIEQIVQSTDANGYSTYFNYDELGRPTQTCNPDGGVRQLSYRDWGDPTRQLVREFVSEDPVTWCEEADENGVKWQEVDENNVRGIWTETRLDGLGRTRAVFKEGDTPGEIFKQDTAYGDTSSRVYLQSQWYEVGEEDPIWESFDYDELGRLTSQSHRDGEQLRWEYGEDGTRTSVTSVDELGNRKTVYNDAFGRTVQVREVNFTGTDETPKDYDYDTFYEYDALDNPTKITDDKGNVTTMIWDSLERQLTLDDPDMGHWTYDEYDNVGNLKRQTDARGVTTEFTYDEINRPETKRWNPPHGEITKWNYDEEDGHGKAPVGRLTSVSDPTGSSCANGHSEQLSYDEMGQVSSETKCVLGRQYTTGTGYDLLGRQSWVEYPDGEKVNYEYDTAGRLERMWSSDRSYVDSLRYDAAGNLTYAKLPNGLEENFHYDLFREWLTEASVQPADDSPHQQRCGDETPPQPQGELYQACYKYKPNGLIESTSSTTNKMNLSFTYDDLNRLTDVTGDMEQHLDYDSIGNMTHNSTLGDYDYRPSGSDGCGDGGTNAGPHAVCQAGSRVYGYDANGNMTLRDGMEIRWNEENLPEWIQYQKGKWEHYLYDASGERVFKEDTGDPTKGKQKQKIQPLGSHENQSNVPGTKRIVVSPGDSLWLISSRWLGPNATLQEIDTAVEQIYALNRDQIGPDPDLIFPGQKFLVPPTWGPERVEHRKGKREHRHNDASDRRVLKEPTGDLAKAKRIQEKGTYYFGPLLSYSSSGPTKGLTKYYYAGPMLIAQNNSDGTHWFHSDHLGSTRLVTNQDGKVAQRYDYEPFGLGSSQLAGQKFENDIGFAGHRTDANTGLSYMGARYYDPQLARFISPDSILPEEYNPQALNRYSYVYNSPMSFADPTGHQSCGVENTCATVAPASQSGTAPTMVFKEGLTVYGRLPDAPPRSGVQVSCQKCPLLEGRNLTLGGYKTQMEMLAADINASAAAAGPSQAAMQAARWATPPPPYSGPELWANLPVDPNNMFRPYQNELMYRPVAPVLATAMVEVAAGTAAVARAGLMVRDVSTRLYVAAPRLWNTALAIGHILAGTPTRPMPQVTLNRLAGNAYRDELVNELRAQGYIVKTEVYKRTPFGARYIDIEIWEPGATKALGGVEAKVGGGRYTPLQRLKDLWLATQSYQVVLSRKQ